MPKEMLINVSEGEECRIALLDDGKLDELYMERTSSTSHVGNIYKGRVTNVEASIQAAFIDFGLGRNGFLHISDLMPSYFGRGGNDIQESVGKKMARRDRPPIQRCLRRGDEIIVQIIKEGIGTKGPTLSTYLSIPGRILVMMPGMGKMGVSKKIEDEEERRRLRTILDSLKPPKGVGFIIRTAGIGKSKAEIQRDLTYLSRLWMQIEKKRTSGSGPMELYTEGDLVARTVRDVYSGDIDRLVVDNAEVAKRVKEVIKITSPRTKNKLEVYEEPIPLFHKYGIEKDIELMYSRHVPLPSGGSLVIDSTEAIVAIDVNSGKFRDHSDAEMTAFKTDMEAADEIPRQLKLRDLGGVIICDFIDLRYERHRRELEEKLHENFKKDRAKTKVLRMSQFGIIEITRQRMRPSLKRSIYFDCPHCKGAGLVKTPESMSLDVMRKLAIAAHNERVARLELAVCPDVGFYLLNKKRSSLHRLESESRKRIFVRTEPSLGLDEIKLTLFDGRDGVIILDELGMTPQPPHTSQLNTRPAGHKGRQGRGRDRGRGRGGDDRPPPPRRGEDFDMDEAEEALEEREVRRERTPADDALAASIAPKIVVREEVEAAPPEAIEGEIVDEQIEAEPEESEEEQNVVDVDDGPSELGDRPAGEWDRQGDRGGRDRGRRGGRGGRDRGRGRDDQRQGGPKPQQRQGGGQPQQRQGGAPQQQREQRDPRDQPQRDQRAQQLRDQRAQQPPRDQRPPQQRDQRGGQQPRDPRGGGGFRDQRPQQNRGPGGFQPRGGPRRDQRGGGRGGPRDQRPAGFQHPMFKTPAALAAHEAELKKAGAVPPPPGNDEFPTGEGYQGHSGNYGGSGGGEPAGPGPAGVIPTGGEPAGAGYGSAGYGGGGYGTEGGRKRRRRRGGRRHRRRRERERMEREQGGLPPGLPADDLHEDDAEGPPRDEQDREPQPIAEREPEPQREPEPEPVEEAPAEESAPKKRRPARKNAAPAKSRRAAPKRSSKPAAQSKAPPEPETPVVKTGSADKHLADDEPVESQPSRRPRRRDDLDAIPDDYD